jgi:hypothetical protein
VSMGDDAVAVGAHQDDTPAGADAGSAHVFRARAGGSGAVTVAHDRYYGGLTGTTVTLEPSAGFGFDSPLEPRPRNAFR